MIKKNYNLLYQYDKEKATEVKQKEKKKLGKRNLQFPILSFTVYILVSDMITLKITL